MVEDEGRGFSNFLFVVLMGLEFELKPKVDLRERTGL
jgi:hypothetical protein